MKRERQTFTSSVLEDSVLVKAFLAGDQRAFDILVTRHQNMIFNVCYRLIGDYEEANDSAQETFIKAFSSLKGFRSEASFSTWLYRIAVNTCKNKLSSLKYRFNMMMSRLDRPREGENSCWKMEILDDSSSPEPSLERKELEMHIQREIDSLPKDQKLVIVLRDIEGLSYEEVAQITGFNKGTVKSKLARARQRLRKRLEGKI